MYRFPRYWHSPLAHLDQCLQIYQPLELTCGMMVTILPGVSILDGGTRSESSSAVVRLRSIDLPGRDRLFTTDLNPRRPIVGRQHTGRR